MTGPTDDLIARARAALQGVTPGPWEIRDSYVYPLSARLGGIRPADAEFIAAARQLIPALVDRLEFLEHEFEAERDRADKHFDAWLDAECSVTALKKTVARVRELHQTVHEYGDRGGPEYDYCRGCGARTDPCPTIAAIDGTGEP